MAGTPRANAPLQTLMLVVLSIVILKYSGHFGKVSEKATELLYGKMGCMPLDVLGNVTLHYFSSRGRLEPIRMLLAEADINYTETKFTKETWPQHKELGIESGLYLFGQVPAMETTEGITLSQSGAIIRYLARYTGLDCSCSQYHRCDAIAATLEDARQPFSKVVYDFSDKSRYLYLHGSMLNTFSHLERLAPEISQDDVFMIEDRVTFIDFLTFNLLENHVEFFSFENKDKVNIFEKFPKLGNFFKSFASRERIESYISSKSRYAFTMPVSKK